MQLCRLYVAVGRRPNGESAEELEYRCKRNVRCRLKLCAEHGMAGLKCRSPVHPPHSKAQHASEFMDVRPISLIGHSMPPIDSLTMLNG
jgi:hypothetical protein